MLYALPLIAVTLAGCCTMPAVKTAENFLAYGLDAKRDQALLECAGETFVARVQFEGSPRGLWR